MSRFFGLAAYLYTFRSKFVVMLLFLFVLVSFRTLFCYKVEDELVTVLVIYRHGDRTPITTYPNDPYRNASFWPVEFGQLTNTGKVQHFVLGQWLRNRYKNFIPEQYSSKEVYVRSTNVDRTLMSAEANLAGLFPPRDTQIWKKDLEWQPIPIHTIPETADELLAMKSPCDKYMYLFEKLMNSAEFIEIKDKNQDLYDYLSKHSGKDIRSLENLLYLYDTLLIESLYNFTLPDWTKTVFPDKMAPWAKFTFTVDCYTPELARLKAGPLLNNIISHFTNSTSNNGYKLIAYSAHDSTIANVLTALQLFKHHCPPYGATLLFELRRTNGTYFVNILYKQSSTPEKLILKNCSFYCPLDKFTEILKPLLITLEQRRHECEFKDLSFTSKFIMQGGIFAVGLVFLVLLSIYIAIRIVSRIITFSKYNYVRLPNQESSFK